MELIRKQDLDRSIDHQSQYIDHELPRSWDQLRCCATKSHQKRNFKWDSYRFQCVIYMVAKRKRNSNHLESLEQKTLGSVNLDFQRKTPTLYLLARVDENI